MSNFLDTLLAKCAPFFRFVMRALPWLATALLVAVLGLIIYASGFSLPVLLQPEGIIAQRQRDTLYLATLIMLIIIVPVFALTAFIGIRYREGNKKRRYTPEWASNHKLETIWWGIPVIIVFVLSVLTYQTSHELDPYRAITSDTPAIKVQVVSLQWKWLFIYPERGIASVNELAIPVNTPVEFQITSDAPMNSFWIPQLGGQIYAMTGMSTELNLAASKPGDYMGVSANLSGKGHAQMSFVTKAMSMGDYESWVTKAYTSNTVLDSELYENLRKPTTENKVEHYSLDDAKLYDSIIARYSKGHDMRGMTH